MKKIIFFFFCFFLFNLTGCSWILYKPEVEQGNIITNDMTSQLRIGMTPQQVRYILGNPVLTHSFDLHHWDYVYTLRQGNKPTKIERVTLYFENGYLQNISPKISILCQKK